MVFSISLSCFGAAYSQTPAARARTIMVPVDYKIPGFGRAPLYFELGARYERDKPTVFIIADASNFMFNADLIYW